MSVSSLMALLIVSQAAPVSTGYPPPGNYRHNCRITDEYDRFADGGSLKLQLGSVFKDLSHVVDVNVVRYYKGKARDKGNVSLNFMSRSINNWQYLKYHPITFLVAGERWTFDPRRDGDTFSGGVLEQLNISLTEQQFLKLANAVSVEIKLGLNEFAFTPSQREAIKDFASYLDNPALPIKPMLSSQGGSEAVRPLARDTIPRGEGIINVPQQGEFCIQARSLEIIDEIDRLLKEPATLSFRLKDSLAKLKESHDLYLLRTGTRVRILKIGWIRNRPEFALAPKVYQVQVLEGPNHDQIGWCFTTNIIAGPLSEEVIFAEKARSEPLDKKAQENRAENRFVAAKNLEKAGKLNAAISNYEEIIRDFGTSPAAVKARDRLKVLGK